MPFIITNRAVFLLIVTLNSGETLHLAPGESSAAIEDYELKDNEGAQKLLRENLISATKSEEAQAAAPASVNQEARRSAPQRSRRTPRSA
jgi:hypothetical protein